MASSGILPPNVRNLIRLALEEDLGRGDLTSLAVPASAIASGRIIAKSRLTISGLDLVNAIFHEAGLVCDRLTVFVQDGEHVDSGTEILAFRGPARELLGVERTLLNFLQRACGVATISARYREALRAAQLAYPSRVLPTLRVVDTRKTLPGFRFLDKRAVRDGGLNNHRFGLDSGVLLKENHLRAAGGIRAAMMNLKGKVPHGVKVEVEVTSRAEAMEAIEAGAEQLLLDNFSSEELTELVAELRRLKPGLVLEASGNMSLDRFAAYAVSGVDLISVGALTHSVPAADLSLLFEFV